MAMDNSVGSDEDVSFSANGHVLSSSSFKGSEVIGNETVFYEKFLLDDLDNYWDELNDRLIVSRMVNDSIIKGMMHAVVEESTEKIATKDAEISFLNEKLKSYDNYSFVGNMPISYQSSQEANVQWSFSEDIGRLKLAAEEQLQKLKEDIHNWKMSSSTRSSADVCLTDETVESLRTVVAEIFKEVNELFYSVKSIVSEQQWKHEFEREIHALVVENSMRSLQAEFEKKLYEQRSLINTLKMDWQQKVNELSSMREDLNAISTSLSSSESGPLLSHKSMDGYDELNTSVMKDHSLKVLSNHHLPYTHNEQNGTTVMKQADDWEKPMFEVANSSQLKHLSRDELVTYYIDEMIKMRRRHDSALQEKTEELFRLKREFLREKGSSLFKKDKEFELLKRRIPEVILKLDDILVEKESLPVIQNDHDEVCSLKVRIDTLLSENQRLRYLVTTKSKEVKSLSSQISNAASQMSNHLSEEAKFLLQTKKVKEDLEDVTVEASIQNEVYSTILKEIVGENRSAADDLEIKARIVQDIYAAAFRGLISDGTSTINSIILKYFNEKSALQTLLGEKEEALYMETKEKKNLKETLASLSSLMVEKEKCVSETSSTLMQQKRHFDILSQEIEMLRGKVKKQEVLISNNKVESYSMKKMLNEALQQIRLNEMEVKELNGKLVIASNALEEAENQKSILRNIVEDKENKLLSTISKEKQQAKQMDSIVISLMELSKQSIDFQNKIAEDIERNGTRLKILSSQCRPLLQQTNLFGKRAYLYQHMLEIRSSNLQKAEAEVDLLGDEVDALLSLLGKIYVALDHYSPVLQHYPGVMEILKLVQRELEGETTKSV